MPVIYKITSPTNKVYIGQTWGICSRKSSYKTAKCKEQPAIYNSIIKYGWDNHMFEVINTLPEDVAQEVLDRYELLYWEFYKDCNVKMLNIKQPGRGGKHSEETKLKIKEANTGSKNNMYGLFGSNHPAFGNIGYWKGKTKENHTRFGICGKDHQCFGRTQEKHPMFGKRDELSPFSKKVINLDTKEIYPSIKNAALLNNLHKGTLAHYLCGKRKNKTNLELLSKVSI